MTAEISLFTPV